MVVEKAHDDDVDRIFRALADSTRRDILRRTLRAEESVSNLARDYEMSFAAVQKHVAVLEAADLVIKRAQGRERLVRAQPQTIARAKALLADYERMWHARIDRLDALFANDDGGTNDDAVAPSKDATVEAANDDDAISSDN